MDVFFQKKSIVAKRKKAYQHVTSWECRARVTLRGCNSDVKLDNVKSYLVVDNNMVNIKWYVLNTQVVNLNGSWERYWTKPMIFIEQLFKSNGR